MLHFTSTVNSDDLDLNHYRNISMRLKSHIKNVTDLDDVINVKELLCSSDQVDLSTIRECVTEYTTNYFDKLTSYNNVLFISNYNNIYTRDYTTLLKVLGFESWYNLIGNIKDNTLLKFKDQSDSTVTLLRVWLDMNNITFNMS
jgi:hypothetical protein